MAEADCPRGKSNQRHYLDLGSDVTTFLASQNVGCFLRLQIDSFSEEKTLNEHVIAM